MSDDLKAVVEEQERRDKMVRVESTSLPGIFEEVFLLVENGVEAGFVDRVLNAGEARDVKNKRMKALAEAGELSEVEMPDVKDAIRYKLHEKKMMTRRIENVPGRARFEQLKAANSTPPGASS